MVLIRITKPLSVSREVVRGAITVGEAVGAADGVAIMGRGVGAGLSFLSILGVKAAGVLRKLSSAIGVLAGLLSPSAEPSIGRTLFRGLDIESAFVLLSKLGGVGRVQARPVIAA